MEELFGPTPELFPAAPAEIDVVFPLGSHTRLYRFRMMFLEVFLLGGRLRTRLQPKEARGRPDAGIPSGLGEARAVVVSAFNFARLVETGSGDDARSLSAGPGSAPNRAANPTASARSRTSKSPGVLDLSGLSHDLRKIDRPVHNLYCEF
jgi:hypothetical protein